jgi:hypothetical protein
MSGVQEYLIDQEIQKANQLVEISIRKALPTMLDVAKGMAKWLGGQGGSDKTGQRTLKQLTKYGDKLSQIPLDSDQIKKFTHIARKHGVSFALSQDAAKNPPRHTVYYRARDTESMAGAFNEYLSKEIRNGKTKEKSFKERMGEAKEKANISDKDKTMKREVGGR